MLALLLFSPHRILNQHLLIRHYKRPEADGEMNSPLQHAGREKIRRSIALFDVLRECGGMAPVRRPLKAGLTPRGQEIRLMRTRGGEYGEAGADLRDAFIARGRFEGSEGRHGDAEKWPD